MTTTTDQPGASFDWDTLTLTKGSHELGDTDDCGNPALCFMEALNASRGLWVTDACPSDVSETLHAFIIGLNDALGTIHRQQLKPYRDRIGGTNGQLDADRRAAYMCVDWLIRTHTVAFLRVAGLIEHADALAHANEIVDFATLGQVTERLLAARLAAYSAAHLVAQETAEVTRISETASAAYSTAYSAAAAAADSAMYLAAHSVAYSAGRLAVYSETASAAYSVAYSTARAAAYLAAHSVAYSAGRLAVYSGEHVAAYSAARAARAARAAANLMLAPTVAALQASAFDLLDRMLAAYTVVTA